MTLVPLPRILAAALPPRLRLIRPEAPDVPPPMPPRPGSGLRRGWASLRHRNYRVYWFGQIGSLVGTWMQTVSQPWLVLELGGSAFQVGAVIALQFAPAMFLAPLGGVLADRVDKRRALMIAQAVAMAEASVLFGLTVSGSVEIWHIMVLASVLGLVNAAEMPLRQSFTAEMVPREDLVNAIALNSASFNLARVLGPAIAGVAIAIFGIAFNFGFNAVSYLAVLVALLLMKPELLHRAERPETYPRVWASLGEGIRFALRTPLVLWPLVLLAGIAVAAMNFQTLLPLYARQTLELGSEGYGALFASMGIGSLTGSLYLAFRAGGRPLLRFMLGGGVIFVSAVLGLGLSALPLLSFPLLMAAGMSAMLMVNTINVTIQHSVPDALRGRVMSLYVMVFAGSAPFGGLFAGAVAEVAGPQTAFLIGAAIAAVVLVIVAWKLVSDGTTWGDVTAPSDRREQAA